MAAVGSVVPMVRSRTFVDLVSAAPQPIPAFDVPFRAPKVVDGELCFLFSKDEIRKSAEPFWFSLVLKFLRRRPSLDAIRAFIRSRWGLSGIPVVSSMSKPRNVFIRFQSESDLNKALSREATDVDGVHYRAFLWLTDFSENEEPSLVPVWINLPGLPPNFYHSSFLKIFTAPIGRFICCDNFTRCATRIDGARVCVEMDAAKPPLNSFWIGTPGSPSSWLQEVVFETLPAFCIKCKLQGHNGKTCKTVELEHVDPENLCNEEPMEDLVEVTKLQESERIEGNPLVVMNDVEVINEEVEEGEVLPNQVLADNIVGLQEVDPGQSMALGAVLVEKPDLVNDALIEQVEEVEQLASQVYAKVDYSRTPQVEIGDAQLEVLDEEQIWVASLFDSEGANQDAHIQTEKEVMSEPEDSAKTVSAKMGNKPFVDEQNLRRLQSVVSFEGSVSNQELGGKLWVQWSKEVKASVMHFSSQSITMAVEMNGKCMWITFVYAKCNYGERQKLWDDLCGLQSSNVPWIVIGDFNIIRSDNERIGGHPRPRIALEEFNSFIDMVGLTDLGFQGNKMTWCNGQEGSSRSWARLDRALVNLAHNLEFPLAGGLYLPKFSSYPAILQVDLCLEDRRYGHVPFKFQQMWTTHDAFMNLVTNEWKEDHGRGGMFQLARKLKKLKGALRLWNLMCLGGLAFIFSSWRRECRL
ncbi:uncharacterized protein LOC122278495 [Carya illinoinensis]|uniref:uncharacterized protein LOC122278495 n=1 Tax=Carya illinoinensis TaxID=32201 RepID=UPI001C7288F9|nr:uncharacterized protein LOC122278495 [Carya illinoinensis]